MYPVSLIEVTEETIKKLKPDEETFAFYDPTRSVIFYCFNGIPDQKAYNIMWHEFVHVIEDSIFSYEDCTWNEHCVQSLANVIHQIETQLRLIKDE
jgi:hypothetical protein